MKTAAARRTVRILLLVLLGACLPGAYALERGGLPGDGAYVTGGVGLEEIAQLNAERAQHALWIVTAAKGSGAYLADAAVTIVDARGRKVFDRVLAGPWLLIDLQPGKYTVHVSFEGRAQEKVVSIRGAGTRQLMFHFDVPDEVRS